MEINKEKTNVNEQAMKWLNDSKLGYDIWNNKYRWNNENFNEWLDRVSNNDSDIKQMILDKKFLFGGRILANYNTGNSNVPSNCFVGGYVGDSIKEIMEACEKASLTFKKGGGIGFNLGKIRPRGAVVSNQNGWKSEGIIPFMELLDQVTKTISQNGRRGALSLILSVDHPDIIDFIKVKENGDTKITSANLSVIVTDEFMKSVESKTKYRKDFIVEATGETIEHYVDAPMIYDLIMEKAHAAAEPGILFWDSMKKNHLGIIGKDGYELEGNNPCFTGDTEVLTEKGNRRLDGLVGMEVQIWNGFEWSKVKPKITGINQEIMKLKFDDGSELKCTPYHKFYIKRNKNISELKLEAKDLILNDRIIDCLLPNGEIHKGQTLISIEKLKKEDKVYCFNEPKRHTAIFNGVYAGQCMEVYGSKDTACNLASMNLEAYYKDGKFDYNSFYSDVKKVFKSLDKVIDYATVRMPVEGQRINAETNRNMGLGVMGIADLFIKMKIAYGSTESCLLIEKIMKNMYDASIEASCELAKENGSIFTDKEIQTILDNNLISKDQREMVHTYGLRNISMLSIAPTGSISNILSISGGLEPVFRNYYERRTESLHGKDVTYKIFHKSVKEEMDKNNGKIPNYCVSSDMIDWKNRIDLQSSAQKYVDLAISSTVNLPKETKVEEIKELYMYAWKKGLKGITIYRDGSLDGILNEVKEDSNDKEEVIELQRGDIKEIAEDTIYYPKTITTGCGKVKLFVGYSKNEGCIQDLYTIRAGNGGGCDKNITSTVIFMSQVLRLGGNVMDMQKAINGISACASYAKREGTSKGSSCASGIMYSIIEFLEEIEGKNIKPLVQKTKKIEIVENVKEEISGVVCPECGEKLNPIGGCWSCPACSFTKCE